MILSIQYVFRNYTSIDFRFTDQLNNETQDNKYLINIDENQCIQYET